MNPDFHDGETPVESKVPARDDAVAWLLQQLRNFALFYLNDVHKVEVKFKDASGKTIFSIRLSDDNPPKGGLL